MNIYLYIILGAIGIIGGLILFKRIRTWRYYSDIWFDLGNKLFMPKDKAKFKYEYSRTLTMPKFISVVELPYEARIIATDGIQRALSCAKRTYTAWDKDISIEDYTVLFVEPMAINTVTEPGSPAIYVGSQRSAGSAIGVTSGSRIEKPHLVLPHQQGQDWDFESYLYNTCRYETEHAVINANDEVLAQQTMNITHVHPLIPDENESEGLYADTAELCPHQHNGREER